MKFLFVMGGSYKSFYINELNNIKKIDLLIFNQNIFYDFDYEQEYLQDAPVTKELIALNNKFHCPIIVFGYSKFMNVRQKCFIICVNGKVSVIEDSHDVYLYIKGKTILIGNKIYKNSKVFATISKINENDNWKFISKNNQNNYFICNKKCVLRLQNGKIYRKFRKYSYFSLNLYKKMI